VIAFKEEFVASAAAHDAVAELVEAGGWVKLRVGGGGGGRDDGGREKESLSSSLEEAGTGD
jgi:hypothetical protein